MAAVTNVELLANAIVERAADDYRKALCKLREIQIELEDLERFFTGEDVACYTNLDGNMILDGIRKQCEEFNYSYKAIKKSLYEKIKNEEEMEEEMEEEL